MLYELFLWLDELDLPGAGLFHFISFRAAMTLITSLIISTLIGKRIIRWLARKQVGEEVRDLGLHGQKEKQGTPTMGGIIILVSLLIPVLLFARLSNIYILLMLLTTVWLGAIGYLDDYIKVFKKNKAGLAAKFKIAGQMVLGLIVGLVMFFHPDIVTGEKLPADQIETVSDASLIDSGQTTEPGYVYVEERSTSSTIPFVKDNEFNYEWLLRWLGEGAVKYTWVLFVLIIILIITFISNGANLTDGLDGLATGSSAIMGVTLGILAYVS